MRRGSKVNPEVVSHERTGTRTRTGRGRERERGEDGGTVKVKSAQHEKC